MSACCSCTWCGRCAKSDRWIPVFVNWCRPGSWGRRSLQYTGEKTKKKLLFFFFLMTQFPFAVETVTQSLYLGAGWAHDRFVELSIYKHLQSLIKKNNVFCKEKKQHFFKSRFEKFFLCVFLSPCIRTQRCRYCSPARPVVASPSQSWGCSDQPC